jgi:hypothetical protein
MKTSDFKFRVTAVLCLCLVIPIFSYVQKQVALAPQPQLEGTSLRERRWAQREALRSWLERNVPEIAVAISPGDPHVVDVALKPGMTQAEAIAHARRVQMVMTTYFHEGLAGAVTIVNLHTSRGPDMVSVVTGVPDRGNFPTNSWHISRGRALIQ